MREVGRQGGGRVEARQTLNAPLSAKEPCISAKEPCISAKKTYTHLRKRALHICKRDAEAKET